MVNSNILLRDALALFAIDCSTSTGLISSSMDISSPSTLFLFMWGHMVLGVWNFFSGKALINGHVRSHSVSTMYASSLVVPT